MATHSEITEALRDFVEQYNSNKQLRKMNRKWTRVIQIRATDIDSAHTLKVSNGEIKEIEDRETETPDVIVSAESETLCDMFWGDLNPSEKYLAGEIKVKGPSEDIMRIDVISTFIWGD
ncbi:MAG: SCP2 sterol-binding domain-containing protein [Candidatus Methanofastidiosia archaeon]